MQEVTENRPPVWHEIGDKVESLNGFTDRGGNKDTLLDLVESVAYTGMEGVEIGCYTGTTASWVLPVFKEYNGILHCIDWFRGSVATKVGYWQWADNAFPAPGVLLQTLKNFEIQGFLDNVTVTIGRGMDMAPMILDGALDYVYIGADHRYTPFKADLLAWLPKVRSGGVICGHAYSIRNVKPGDNDWEFLCNLPEVDCGRVQLDKAYEGHFGITRALHEVLPGFQNEGEIWFQFA